MAFDPDAFLANTGPAPVPGGFDPDAFLAKNTPDQSISSSPAPEYSPANKIDEFIMGIPGGPVVSEIAAGVNRGTSGLIDILINNRLNDVTELMGQGRPVPTMTNALSSATEGNFMQPGLAREVVRTGSEFAAPVAASGQVIRGLAKGAPLIESAIPIAQQYAKTLASTPGKELVLGVSSGAGSAIGKEVGGEPGALVGALLAPAGVIGGQKALTGLVNLGKSGINALMRPLANMSDDAASTLIAEAMVREGLDEKQILAKLQQLGPEAVPADLGNNFARLLRTASNKIPRIEGQTAEVLGARHAGQGQRILESLDDATRTGTRTLDDTIAHMEQTLKPQITKLYGQTRGQTIELSEKLRTLLSGKNSLGKASKKAQVRLADRRAAGDEITNIDMIDATKQELDDQIGAAIRKGANNKARDLIRLKNVMVEEADNAIPKYKEARDLFAGKASLENAADAGQNFLRMKPADISALTKNFSQSEKTLYRLGAKKAILEKIDDTQMSADLVKRLFGKNGDIKKLRTLFDDEASFKKFESVMQREADFSLTRRAAQANSTTAKQLADEESGYQVLSQVAEATTSPSGFARFLNKVVNGVDKGKQDKIYIKALEDAGDFLLTKGVSPEKIQAVLKEGNAKYIKKLLMSTVKMKTLPEFLPGAVGGAKVAGDNLATMPPADLNRIMGMSKEEKARAIAALQGNPLQ